jgi:hypothetical protein
VGCFGCRQSRPFAECNGCVVHDGGTLPHVLAHRCLVGRSIVDLTPNLRADAKAGSGNRLSARNGSQASTKLK